MSKQVVHEAAKKRAEMYVHLSAENVILNDFDLNLSRAYLDLDKKVQKYQARLEITHDYDGHTGEKREIPQEKRDTYPDGIFCRDATIQILKDELTAERERVDRLEKQLEEATRALAFIGDRAVVDWDGETVGEADKALEKLPQTYRENYVAFVKQAYKWKDEITAIKEGREDA